MLFDIVIPVGPNDISLIQLMIQYTRQNVIGFRNIYLVSYDDTLKVDGCITISETIYPFAKPDICAVLGPNCRQNWYLQQLLKLYAMFVIPDILDNVLIIDTDTFFLKPTRFFDDNGKTMVFYLGENNEAYFPHMKRLHNSLSRIDIDKSGVCHHVMFQKMYLNELFKLVEQHHTMGFWKAFLNCIDPDELSGASEYEIYFNFMLKYHRDKIKLRKPVYNWIKSLDELHHDKFDFVSYHHWYR
jgi:hypothetical protein